MSGLAPILVFAYNRANQLDITIQHLLKNDLASESDLYIFSDGPKNSSDAKKVENVRDIVNKIKGFKSVNIVMREKNYGLANSIISGVSEIINQRGSVIVVEDDLITSPNFLLYMNDALKYYKEEKNIFSISGYSLPLKNKTSLKSDVFFHPRAGSWGWATWKDRWQLADWEIQDFEEFRNNKSSQKQFNIGGEDLTPMLKAQMKGNIDSWAIRWCYTLFKNNGICVYPKLSKVSLIEKANGGTHVKNNSMFRVELDEKKEKSKFTKDYSLHDNILSEMNNLMKPSIIRKVINHFKYDFIK